MFLLTPGIQALGMKTKSKVFSAVAKYEFTEEEQDEAFENEMGFFEIDGLSIVWKIDCYDKGLLFTRLILWTLKSPNAF